MEHAHPFAKKAEMKFKISRWLITATQRKTGESDDSSESSGSDTDEEENGDSEDGESEDRESEDGEEAGESEEAEETGESEEEKFLEPFPLTTSAC